MTDSTRIVYPDPVEGELVKPVKEFIQSSVYVYQNSNSHYPTLTAPSVDLIASAFSKLCEVLAAKGVLDANDLALVAGLDPDDASDCYFEGRSHPQR